MDEEKKKIELATSLECTKNETNFLKLLGSHNTPVLVMLELESLLGGASLGDCPDVEEVSRVDVTLGGCGECVTDDLQGLVPAQQPLLHTMLVLEADLVIGRGGVGVVRTSK